MIFKRLILFVFTLALFSGSGFASSYAVQKSVENSLCKLAGQVLKEGSRKLVCLKVGNKLKWKRLYSTKTTKATQARKETNKTTASQSSKPAASEPSEGDICTPSTDVSLGFPKGPGLRIYLRCNLETLKYEPYDLVAYPEPIMGSIQDLYRYPAYFHVAWKKVNDLAGSGYSTPLKLNVRVGPNTTFYNENISETMKRATALYRDFAQPKKVDIVAFNHQDVTWAENELQQIRDNPGIIQAARTFCPSREVCSTVGALGVLNDSGLVVAASKLGLDLYFNSGGLDIHEYTHLVQAQVGSKGRYEETQGPCWWGEAQAMFNGVAAATKDFGQYKTLRSWYMSQASRGAYHQPQNIIEFLKLNMNAKCSTPNSNIPQFGYSVGALIVEAMTAIHGPNASMQVYEEISNGKTFEAAFQASYGATIDTILDQLVPLIAKQFELRLGTG